MRITPQYADKPKNMPAFNLLFLISEGNFFSKLGIYNSE